MLNAFQSRSDQPSLRQRLVGITGAGAANPVKRFGAGATITRTGTGAYLITWAENPGNFVGWSYSLGADTPADVAGHTAVRGAYNATTFSLAFTLYETTPVAHDLAAAEYLDITVDFLQSGVTAG
jgi:hypothetical protein